MENNPNIRTWSDLKKLAVVALDSGAKVGNVEDFYFDPTSDPATNPISGIRVKAGMFSSKALVTQDIKGIGQDAITIQMEDALIEEKNSPIFSKVPLGSGLLSYKVLSESGNMVGTIGELLFDVSNPTQLRLVTFEIQPSLRERISGHRSLFNIEQVVRYGQDVLVIPDSVAEELQK